MKVFSFNTTHRTFLDLITRLFKILNRYGLLPNKMEFKLGLYLDILKGHGVKHTFLVTAEILRRYPTLFRRLSKQGVEFAVHGYNHIDYTKLSDKEMRMRLEKAIKIFKEQEIQPDGYRFPYLKWDSRCLNSLGSCHLKWDSSHSILWEVVDSKNFENRWEPYQEMLNYYPYKNSLSNISLPRKYNHLLEIPLSLPDDDLLTDRLGIKDEKMLFQIWGKILKRTHIRGELFTLLLHPERISLCKETLKALLQATEASDPKIWVASLNEISEWWKEKESFLVKLSSNRSGLYEVDIKCSARGTILIRSNEHRNGEFYNGFSIVKEHRFSIKSKTRPIIGIPESSPSELREFLKNEGFIYEVNENKQQYSLYLDNFSRLSEEDEMKALEIIHNSNSPLIRFWRWPAGYKSALAITGDIDALTSVDFFLRLFG